MVGTRMSFLTAFALAALLGGNAAIAGIPAKSGDFLYRDSHRRHCFIHKKGPDQYEMGEIKSDGTRMIWVNAITGSPIQPRAAITTQLDLENVAINERNFAKRDDMKDTEDPDLVGQFNDWYPGTKDDPVRTSISDTEKALGLFNGVKHEDPRAAQSEARQKPTAESRAKAFDELDRATGGTSVSPSK